MKPSMEWATQNVPGYVAADVAWIRWCLGRPYLFGQPIENAISAAAAMHSYLVAD